MAKVFVEGDPEAFGMIAAALDSAGLSSVDVELVARPRSVTHFPASPGNWAAFADLAPELSYTEWREEVLSLVGAEEPATLRSALSLCESVVTGLRRAG
ncbi:MAG TPA: hypothetical protein VGR20_06835 [Acidimicrobiia bacterium]|jgi:hypothetical protein|nr:hypothetical protein [Acidimicrobiia bacterium]